MGTRGLERLAARWAARAHEYVDTAAGNLTWRQPDRTLPAAPLGIRSLASGGRRGIRDLLTARRGRGQRYLTSRGLPGGRLRLSAFCRHGVPPHAAYRL